MWEITMTDPRDFDGRMDLERRMEMERSMVPASNAMWGWIAGGLFILVVLALVFNSGDATRTASTDVSNPPATTGVAPPARTTAPAMAPAREPPSTTGQGTR
jgi:hypothetical protein